MNEDRKQELTQLLTEAMNEIVIKVDEGQTMLLEAYRSELLLSRRVYRPNSNTEQRFYPDLRNDVKKSQLLDFIREELTSFIHEDKILSSSYFVSPETSFGGIAFSYPLSRLLQQLLKVAILHGINAAVLAFDKATKDTSGSCQIIRVLEGIRLKTQVQVEDGLRLIPLPNSVTKFPPCFPDELYFRITGLAMEAFIGKTLLVIDASVSPAFYGDRLTMDDIEKLQYEPPISRKGENFAFCIDNGYLKFQDNFLSSLSLTCNTVVQVSLQLNFLNEDTLFNLSRGRVGNTVYYPQAISRSSTEVEETHIDEAKRLYQKLDNFDSETLEKLQIAIDRWKMSKNIDRSPIDRMIDLGIAFESLYLSDISETTELSFRLRLRAAWFLGKDKAHRQELMKDFSKIYEWRSKVVHTGKLPNKRKKTPFTWQEIAEFTEKVQDLCRESIMKILEAGKFPDDWNSLILGEESS